MLEIGQFDDFISGFIRIRNDELNEQSAWEFYLHRVFDKSFSEFMDDIKFSTNPEVSQSNIETTIKDNFEMMENFHPE